jgi:predicted alpha/beta hydrolase family esterase
MMSKISQLVIVHGFLSTPRHHWFNWLKARFERQGIAVFLPRLPNPRMPMLADWLATLKQTLPCPDENTWFIGHSLGCITLLHYLDSLTAHHKVGGTILVSGFSEPLPKLPQLDTFTRHVPCFSDLKAVIQQRIALLSLNDQVVPPHMTLQLSRQLSAELYSFADCGHFLGCDGFTRFPALDLILHDALK